MLGRGLSGVTRRTATGPSEAGLSPAAALAHVPGMGKGRVAYEKSWAWRIVFLGRWPYRWLCCVGAQLPCAQ